jgi:hypothetical protein
MPEENEENHNKTVSYMLTNISEESATSVFKVRSNLMMEAVLPPKLR